MKKVVALILLLLLVTGCSSRPDNRVDIFGSGYNPCTVVIPSKYEFVDFQKKETSEGCVLIINYKVWGEE